MNELEIIGALNELRYMSETTARLYDAVLPKTAQLGIDEDLRSFREDHLRHARETAELTRRLGHQPSAPNPDFSLFVDEQVQAAIQAVDAAEAMELTLLAERANTAVYARTCDSDIPAEARRLLEAHRDDEDRHATRIAARMPALVAAPGAAGAADSIACMTGGLTDDRNPDDFEDDLFGRDFSRPEGGGGKGDR